jgi:hypothetical protein
MFGDWVDGWMGGLKEDARCILYVFFLEMCIMVHAHDYTGKKDSYCPD